VASVLVWMFFYLTGKDTVSPSSAHTSAEVALQITRDCQGKQVLWIN